MWLNGCTLEGGFYNVLYKPAGGRDGDQSSVASVAVQRGAFRTGVEDSVSSFVIQQYLYIYINVLLHRLQRDPAGLTAQENSVLEYRYLVQVEIRRLTDTSCCNRAG